MTQPDARTGIVRAAGRALLLGCPRCGAHRLLENWFKLKPACPVCALGLRHAPEDDEWFGGYFVNLMASESLMIVVVLGYALWSWPDVKWQAVEVLSVVMVILSPVITYPFAKLLWVAVEFVFAERARMKNRRG